MADEHDRDSALSLAFMRGHPVSAARVLEALPPEDAASIFDRVPARIGATVLAAMLPRQASKFLESLSQTRCLELLAAMNLQATVSLLRYLPAPRRKELIAGLPTTSALASSILLSYNEDALGAWADPHVVMLPAETRAAEALQRVRQTDVLHPTVFVTDASRRLQGVIDLPVLLRAPDAATLVKLMSPPAAVLMAHAPLASTAAHPGWELASALPVLEPGERLIGVMTRDALARALRRNLPVPQATAQETTLPAVLARSYWQTLSGMVGTGLSLLPSVPPVSKVPQLAKGKAADEN